MKEPTTEMAEHITENEAAVREDDCTETHAEMRQRFTNRIFHQKKICYQGPEYEFFIYQRNLWVCIAIISTGIPYIIPFLVAIMSGMNDYPSLYRNGELVLSAMALVSPFILEIFDKKSFQTAWKIFFPCLLVWLVQIMLYVKIRNDIIIKALNDNDVVGVMGDMKILVWSLIIVVFTVVCCICSLHTLYDVKSRSDMNDGGQI